MCFCVSMHTTVLPRPGRVLVLTGTESQLGRLRMTIQKNARAISRSICTALALFLWPVSAYAVAGADIQRSADRSDFVVGSGVSSGAVTLDDADAVWPAAGAASPIGAVSTMQLGVGGFTLAPVGSSGDVRWELFRGAEWDIPEDVAEIPEPAPLAILGIAILGLGFYRIYRNG